MNRVVRYIRFEIGQLTHKSSLPKTWVNIFLFAILARHVATDEDYITAICLTGIVLMTLWKRVTSPQFNQFYHAEVKKGVLEQQ